MGLARLPGLLATHRKIALDTSVFIYQLQANPRYVKLTDQVFEWLGRRNSSAVTSTITMTELLVQPYREANERQSAVFYALLSTYPNLVWIAPDLEIADKAARIRAAHRLRTPDALQAATAASADASALLTNDPIFRRVPQFETILLDDLL